ncbi:unnamed protein product [Urochloa decumbens]|uniref:NB-ARC domain-containing protein n=1 Tax=Urochloa decumbens TaxID=240449 RepID=A0ABC9HFV9_9POAL
MVDTLEVICSVVAGEIFQKIISALIEKYNHQKGIEEKLQQLRQLLITIHSALEVAEGQAITNSWLLRWIRKLEDAACEGGRVLRDWRYRTDEVSSALVNSSNTFKRIKVATALYLSCKETTISIDDTVKKVEIVAAGTLKFIELLKFGGNQPAVHRPIIQYVSMHDRVIIRIKERQCSVDFLLKPTVYQIHSTYVKRFGQRSRAASSIPYGYVLLIWGRKGVGKTTLTQLVCKNEIVLNHFSMVIWVCCRENPSPELAIMRSLCKKLEFSIDRNISHMVYRIAARLRTERFLLVLDGVRSYPRAVEDILIVLLGSSKAGSKVVITTKYEHLAYRIDRCNILPVEFLPMEDLGCLFIENALGGEHPEEYRKLLVIGKEIAETLRECSPLATKVVSGLLRDNLNEKYWCSVLRHCQQFVATRSMVRPFILGCKLLPHHLQSCFRVFGTYPQWKFTREDMIRLWVRHGAIRDKGCKTSIENVAADCFDDLLRKAFIQPSQVPGFYKVDDMLRDTALYIGPTPLPKTRMHKSWNKNHKTSRLIYKGFS